MGTFVAVLDVILWLVVCVLTWEWQQVPMTVGGKLIRITVVCVGYNIVFVTVMILCSYLFGSHHPSGVI